MIEKAHSMAAIATILFGIAVYMIVPGLIEVASGKEEEISKDMETIREETAGTVTAEEMTVFASEGKNPFGQHKSLEELTDGDYREYIHGMSHQKIKADQKWGFYQINDARIDWLLEGLAMENQQEQLRSHDIYKDILERWRNHEFSRVDQDHNTIWELQGGTIGKATGILNADEEQVYIEENQ